MSIWLNGATVYLLMCKFPSLQYSTDTTKYEALGDKALIKIPIIGWSEESREKANLNWSFRNMGKRFKINENPNAELNIKESLLCYKIDFVVDPIGGARLEEKRIKYVYERGRVFAKKNQDPTKLLGEKR